MTSPEPSPSKKSNDCQRFFGFGKKIPKDVKRHCGMCRQHGIVVETRGHLCQFKNCNCWKCKLVRQRRSIMSTQIRLRREQDKKFQRTTDVADADVVPWANEEEKKKKDEINMCYFCQKCKNHGVLMWKKDHKKNCEFASCRCEQCDLIDTRRALDRHIKSNRDTKRDSSGNSGMSLSSSPDNSSSSSSVSSATLPVVNPFSFSGPPSAEIRDPLPAFPFSPLKPMLDPVQMPFSLGATLFPPILPTFINPFTPSYNLFPNLFQQQFLTNLACSNMNFTLKDFPFNQ